MKKLQLMTLCLGIAFAFEIHKGLALANEAADISLLDCKATNYYSPNNDGSLNADRDVASQSINAVQFKVDLEYGLVKHEGLVPYNQKYNVTELTDLKGTRHVLLDEDYHGPKNLRGENFYRINISDGGNNIFFLLYSTDEITTGKCKVLTR